MENRPDQGQPWSGYNPQEPPYQTYQSPYNYQTPPYAGGPANQPRQPQDLGSALRELPAQWQHVLTQPSAATFMQEQPKASWNMFWVMLIGYAVIAAILGAIQAAAYRAALLQLPGFSGQGATAINNLLAITGGYGEILSVPIGFFIGQGILFGLARLFGGTGRFLDQGYLVLLFSVPLGLISLVLGFIPILGGIVGFLLAIYEIVLQIFVIQAAHRLSGGKATAVVLLPVVIGIILFLILATLVVAVLISTSSGIQ